MAKLAAQAQPQNDSQPISVMVTGGLGFVGSAIVRALQEQHPEWSVWIIDKREDPRQRNKDRVDDELDLLRDCEYQYLKVDITNQAEVAMAFELIKADVVVHSAGVVPSLSER